MALVTEFLEQHEDGVIFNRVYSNIPGKCVLQVETGALYGEAAITDTDPYTYEEVDDPDASEDEITDAEALKIITGGVANEAE